MGAPALAFLLLTFVCSANGFGAFVDRIPNGNRVPHPCKASLLWHALGHYNPEGGGNRNDFGQHFERAGKQWTVELCRQDSDGDGMTNGQELGDPDCVWQPGQVPERLTGLSHPGVCDPIDSAACQNRPISGSVYKTQQNWLDDACRPETFDCPAIDAPDVEAQTFRIPDTPVPAKETTYVCQTFPLDDPSRDQHLIATRAIINNTRVMHHMLLYGCRGPNTPIMSTPYECGMAPGLSCDVILSGWTLGMEGDCLYKSAGIRVGSHGYKVLAMQYHWNNPTLEASYTDSSGMVLYTTANLRPYDASMMITGNDYIQVPPRSPGTTVTSDCNPTCTRNLVRNDGIYVYAAFNHMHYLGVSQSIELYRDGVNIHNFTNEQTFNYDDPKMFHFDPPIQVKPGDRILTRCTYKSLLRSHTTFWGEDTSAEMCYGFLKFFPASSMPIPYCTGFNDLMVCDPDSLNGCAGEEWEKFNRPDFNQTQVYRNITGACKAFGACTVECKAAIVEAQTRDPCLADPESWLRIKMQGLATDPYGQRLLASMASCELELHIDAKNGVSTNSTPAPAVAAASINPIPAATATTITYTTSNNHYNAVLAAAKAAGAEAAAAAAAAKAASAEAAAAAAEAAASEAAAVAAAAEAAAAEAAAAALLGQ